MSLSTNASIFSLSLRNYFEQQTIPTNLPIAFSINDKQLALDNNNPITITQQTLVVFDDLLLTDLLTLQTSCH